MSLPDRDAVPRREFLRAAVALGGAAGLSACLGDEEEPAPLDAPTGDDPDARPARQHAWNDVLATDDDGNVRPPAHHVLLGLSLTADPGAAQAREQVATAFRELERALARGPDGLVFTVGYAPAYFDRFDGSLPDSVDLPAPGPMTSLESAETLALDDQDALVHLASDDPAVVLAAEEALLGNAEGDRLNGRELAATLEGAMERSGRRTGFVGPGLPARKQAEDEVRGLPNDTEIPEDAPFWMGFRSGFRESQATEERVTIDSGPFAGGTTQHVESLRLQLETWWDQDDHYRRVAQLFSPVHAEEERVGEVGEELGTSTGAAALADRTAEHARDPGVVGHAQKAARGRIDGEPVLLRRDFDTTFGGTLPGIHFVSLQDGIATYERVRTAMAGQDLTDGAVGRRQNNGIVQYVAVERRGNYLVPPREHRALPRPDP